MSGAIVYTQGSGSYAQNVEIPVISDRSPQVQDSNYPLGKRWIIPSVNSEYVLTSFSPGNIPVWSELSSLYFYIASVGTATLNAGTATVTDAACLTTSTIMISRRFDIGANIEAVFNILDGSFQVASFANTDNSPIAYMIVN